MNIQYILFLLLRASYETRADALELATWDANGSAETRRSSARQVAVAGAVFHAETFIRDPLGNHV